MASLEAQLGRMSPLNSWVAISDRKNAVPACSLLERSRSRLQPSSGSQLDLAQNWRISISEGWGL